MKSFLSNKLGLSIFLLTAVYSVGIVTIWLGHADALMKLTPYNLLFATALLLYNAEKPNTAYVLWFLICAIAGFFVEVIGTATGVVFGNYTYGQTLGLKALNVPLLIGINWPVLVYATTAILLPFGLHWLFRAVLGTVMMVLYDLLLEPVAMRFDFWNWEGGVVPLQNYAAWFIIGLIMQLAVNKFVKPLRNKIAIYVIVAQFILFVLLIYTEQLKIF